MTPRIFFLTGLLALAACTSGALGNDAAGTELVGKPDFGRPYIGDPDLGDPVVYPPDFGNPQLYACDVIGTWRVDATSMGGPGAHFRFDAGGSFVGWTPGASLNAAPTASGSYLYETESNQDLAHGATLSILSSSGLHCSDNAVFEASYTPDCAILSLQATIDNCTGARYYLDGEVTLVRQ